MLYDLDPNNAKLGEEYLKRVAKALTSTQKRKIISYSREEIAGVRKGILLDIKEHDRRTKLVNGSRNAKQLSEFILESYSVRIDKEELRRGNTPAVLATRIISELFDLTRSSATKYVNKKNKGIDFENLLKNAMEITKI
jgi:hypothetical protein